MVLAKLTKLRNENPNLDGWGKQPSGWGKYTAVAVHFGWPTGNKHIKNFFNNARFNNAGKR